MQKEFPTAKLNQWISNFNPNDAVPFVTNSGLIKLEDLEAFVATIKGLKADSVRVYFIRLQANETSPMGDTKVNGELAKGCKWHNASSTLTQGTIALVPAQGFKLDDDLIFSADDLAVGDQILTLLPGIEGKGTGLCPPSCTAPRTPGGH